MPARGRPPPALGSAIVSGRARIDVKLSLDGVRVQSETTYAWASPYVLSVHTVIPQPDLAIELHSTFTGHPGTPTAVTHLMLGPPGTPGADPRRATTRGSLGWRRVRVRTRDATRRAAASPGTRTEHGPPQDQASQRVATSLLDSVGAVRRPLSVRPAAHGGTPWRACGRLGIGPPTGRATHIRGRARWPPLLPRPAGPLRSRRSTSPTTFVRWTRITCMRSRARSACRGCWFRLSCGRPRERRAGRMEVRVGRGFHRVAAAAELRLQEIPIVIREADTEAAAATENIARKQLNPYEEARAVKAMLETGLSEDGAGQALGWPKVRVSARVKISSSPTARSR